ncbi:sensor histidine kinase [Novilysobacter erysipheiresistens]|uniref:histidine kinase n=1 Tax=Novilysobacter erysipheiresistens TaxID=1749332 RepID=A0ABU7Z1E6_9GAMM
MRKLTGMAMRAAGLATLLAALQATAAAASVAATAAAIPEIPTLRHIDVADGLPSSNINGLALDADGYLWLATTDGLARYDGVGMRVWRHVPGDPASLPGNYITVLHADPQGRIWVAPESRGLSVLDPARGGFRHYRKASHPQIGSDEVWAIASHRGATWFGTFGGGLHRLDGDGTITRYMPRDDDPRSLPSDIVLSLSVDGDGRLWIGTTAGLARWTGHDFERVALPGEQPAPMIFSATPVGDSLWVGAGSGPFRRDGAGNWHRPDWAAMFEYPNAIFGVLAEPDGELWLASHRQLWRVSPGEVPAPVQIGAKGPVLPMYQMLRQRDGALWLPVPGVGLGYLQPDWRRIAQFTQDRDGLAAELYPGVAVARGGGVWLAGERGELERLDRDGSVVPLDEAVQDKLDGARAMSLLEDRAGRLWLGQRRALLRIDPGAGTVRRWDRDSATDAPLAGPVDLLAQAPGGDLWVSFAGAGLQRRDAATGKVLETVSAGPEQGLGVGDTEAIGFDRHGVPWIAGGHGLRRWDAAAHRFAEVPGVDIDGRVFVFAFDGHDGLWLQRLSGLEHYRRQGDRWQRTAQVGVAQGIPSVEGAGLRIDRAGRVWLSSLRGLFRWDPKTRHARRFGLPDGLSSQEFVDRTLVMGDDGVLAAALADGGVVLVDTLAPDPPALTPALHFDAVEVRREGQWIALDRSQPLQLRPDDRELRVQLRLLSFDDPRANRYFTRLDGYDRDWIANGTSGERVFAGLPAGDYTLRARAVDASGNAAVEQQLNFSVQPPWWRTPAALAGFAGLLVLLLWWAADEYRERLARREALQRARHENEVAREASLAKTRFLATLGHEVRTPMTGVLGMTELLLGTPLDPRQRGYADSIRGAGEHLLRLVNDALDLARIESGKLELAEQPFDLRALVDDVAALMAPLAEARGLAFAVEFDRDVARGWRGDPVRLRQILLNLVGNAIKFTERGSVMLAVSRDTAAGVHLRVADTGPGLNAEQKGRLFRRFEQAEGARTAARYGGSGLGLAICQELAAAMGGTIAVESSLGVGTTFDVHLPLPEAIAPTGAAPSVAAGPSRALSLLLVEDDPIVAEVIIGLLQAQGHRARHAGHGLAALAEVATGRFDGALLDLDLPGMDGLALAQHLRAQGFDTLLIAITARADADAEPQAMAAGFDRFLRKPVTGAMLRELLDDDAQPVS